VQSRRLHSLRMSGYKTVEQDYATLPGGAKIPVVGLGTWKSKPGEVESAVEHALKVGYRHIDCADAYSNHKEVGEAFNKVFSDPDGPKREDVWITTKLNNPDHEPSKVKDNVTRFLKELQLDYLDCVLIHWPYQNGCKGKELKPSYKSTWQALEAVVDEGLVKHIGVSNISVKKFEDLLTYNRHPVVINQVEIHPYWRNDKLVEFAKSKGLHLTAYSPLGTPDSSSMMGNKDKKQLMEDPVVTELAKKYNKNVGQILIRWAIQHGTSVIPKSANKGRIEANLDVFSWKLEEEDYQKLHFKNQERYLRGSLCIDPEGPYTSPEELWDGEV